jgi:hypothetical protein
MARFVLRDSIPSKILLMAAFAFASVCIEPHVATAQHPITGARMAPPARAVGPPAPRTTVSQPRVVTSPRQTVLGARFGLRPGPNNLFRRRLFFRAPFFRFGSAFAFNGFWWQNCGSYWVWGYYCNGLPFSGYGYGYGFENYVTLQPYQGPTYLYASEERERVWLYLKDGTVYSVSEYWFVNGQVHFIAVEEGGAKSVEQTIPFGELDVQKTVDVNTRRGFRVVMRDKPVDQYMHDHPDLIPPLLEPPPKN